MICTTSFSTGNDYQHVRLVIHAKMPHEMSELIQAQGRGGRDGKPAKCVIITAKYTPRIKVKRNDIDHKGQWFAYDFINIHGSTRCLRYSLTLYIDGKGTECLEDGANRLCSFCNTVADIQGRPTTHAIAVTHKGGPMEVRSAKEASFKDSASRAKEKSTKRQYQVLQDAEHMRKCLYKIRRRGCALCIACKVEPEFRHTLNNCPQFQKISMPFKTYVTWKKGLWYDPKQFDAICWRCHVPICDDTLHLPLEKRKKGESWDCEWEDIVIPTAIGIFHDESLRTQAEETFNVKWNTVKELQSWLTLAPVEHGHYSHAMDLFMWFTNGFLD